VSGSSRRFGSQPAISPALRGGFAPGHLGAHKGEVGILYLSTSAILELNQS
jgi:hypothetical protein